MDRAPLVRGHGVQHHRPPRSEHLRCQAARNLGYRPLTPLPVVGDIHDDPLTRRARSIAIDHQVDHRLERPQGLAPPPYQDPQVDPVDLERDWRLATFRVALGLRQPDDFDPRVDLHQPQQLCKVNTGRRHLRRQAHDSDLGLHPTDPLPGHGRPASLGQDLDQRLFGSEAGECESFGGGVR